MLADAYGSPVEGHKLFDERLAGARVVTLEWRGTEGVWAKADALFGATYRITEYAGMAKPFKLETVGFVGPHGHYGTLDDAKAAAQSDYERRILSAFAEPAGEAEPVAFQFRYEVSPDTWTEWQIGKAPEWLRKSKAMAIEERSLYTTPPASAIREALNAEIERLRPEYQSNSMLNHGRRQMLDHFAALAGSAE